MCMYFKTYLDRKSINDFQVVLRFFQKKSWRRLKDDLRKPPRKCLKKTSSIGLKWKP